MRRLATLLLGAVVLVAAELAPISPGFASIDDESPLATVVAVVVDEVSDSTPSSTARWRDLAGEHAHPAPAVSQPEAVRLVGGIPPAPSGAPAPGSPNSTVLLL